MNKWVSGWLVIQHSVSVFLRLTLCSEVTETKEERKEGEHSLGSTGSHMCTDRPADLSLSALVTVGRPPAHIGMWAAARRWICVGPVSSFSWKQRGSSLPWEFPWTANISYLTYTDSKMDSVFWENQTHSVVFMEFHSLVYSLACLVSLSCYHSDDFCHRTYCLLSSFSLLFYSRLSNPLCHTVNCVCLIFTFHSAAIWNLTDENVCASISNIHSLNLYLSLILKWELFIQVL